MIAALALTLLFAGVAATVRTPDTDPAAMRARYADAGSRFVDLGGGLTVHVRDTGPRDAPVILLLHGSNSSLHTWSPWAVRLEGRFRIVRLDLPGHGLTGADPNADYTAANSTALVDRLADRLGLTRFVIGGNSMGGGIAWAYALAHPERVRGLILVDSVGQPEPGAASAPLLFRIARLPLMRNLATLYTPRSWITQSLPLAYANPALADAAAIDRYWELLRYPGNRLATIDRFALPTQSATPTELARIKAPTLILWGAEDRMIPASSAAWLHRYIPVSRVIVYPRTGHLPMEEAADASARDVAAFMAALS